MIDNDDSPLPDTEVHYLSSEHVGDEFKVLVGHCGASESAARRSEARLRVISARCPPAWPAQRRRWWLRGRECRRLSHAVIMVDANDLAFDLGPHHIVAECAASCAEATS
jgi:hypothetical protein